jgi:hypothetical protein
MDALVRERPIFQNWYLDLGDGVVIYVKSIFAGATLAIVSWAIYFVCQLAHWPSPGVDVHLVDLPTWLTNLIPPSAVLIFLRTFRAVLLVLLAFAVGFYFDFRRVSSPVRAHLPLGPQQRR